MVYEGGGQAMNGTWISSNDDKNVILAYSFVTFIKQLYGILIGDLGRWRLGADNGKFPPTYRKLGGAV